MHVLDRPPSASVRALYQFSGILTFSRFTRRQMDYMGSSALAVFFWVMSFKLASEDVLSRRRLAAAGAGASG